MKYIIMCGGNYAIKKHLLKIGDECIVERTIRLLQECGIKDIAISTNNDLFNDFGVEVIRTDKVESEIPRGRWLSGFYITDTPVCYIFGDVVFSKQAISKIINTQTKDIEFFASSPPFSPIYYKDWAEPFAFKVVSTGHFKRSILKALEYNGWRREPIAWELWQVIKGTPYNKIIYTNYTAINDYTCDVDYERDLRLSGFKYIEDEKLPTKYMIHTYPKRLWYVEQFLIPSMIAQGIDKDNISVYNDIKGEGNLKAFIKSFSQVDNNNGATWHLQDDVLLCKDFKKRTEAHNYGIVCGFTTKLYNDVSKIGYVNPKNMWFSFPCLRVPNQTALNCSKWVENYVIGNPVYSQYWKAGKNDDWCFKAYIDSCEKHIPILNLNPCLVEHIDYLIGGGSGGMRDKECRAEWFDDLELVEELSNQINGGKHR